MTEPEIIIEEYRVLSFEESIPLINEKYLVILNELCEKFKYHDSLAGPLDHDLKLTKDKLPQNKYQVLDTVIDNLLFCLEQISDHNSDYFIYQKEKITKKNGKSYKNKLPKIGNRTLLKKILHELDNKSTNKIFKDILDIFTLLTIKDENNLFTFHQEFIDYVKENYDENKNFSKMIMVIDNIDNILNSSLEICDDAENIENFEEKDENVKKTKSKKGKKSKDDNLDEDFLKDLENTKIAQLAKNITEKINIEDFPELSDPLKLFSSLTDTSGENGGGIKNLLKFVANEVEDEFKENKLNEKDLIGDVQNLMGKFQNVLGFDPMSLLSGNKDNLDLNQFADIFSKMSK